MRGSVFRIAFRNLAGEFESVENSPGFACIIGQNWVLHKTEFKTAVPWIFFCETTTFKSRTLRFQEKNCEKVCNSAF